MAAHIWKSRVPVRLLSALLAVAPLSAHAQLLPAETAQGERMVRLRDGSLVRGELVEERPNHHLSLKLATGEVRHIRWDDLIEYTAEQQPVGPGTPGYIPLGGH